MKDGKNVLLEFIEKKSILLSHSAFSNKLMKILGPHTWELALEALELGYLGSESDGLDVVLCS